MPTPKKTLGIIGIIAITSVLFLACPVSPGEFVQPTPEPTPVPTPVPQPTPTPLVLVFQVEKESVIDTSLAGQATAQAGIPLAIEAAELTGHVFARWTVVSGSNVTIANVFSAKNHGYFGRRRHP